MAGGAAMMVGRFVGVTHGGDQVSSTTSPISTSSSSARVDKSQYDLFHPLPASQLRDMETDRPNVTNSPHTIDPGWVQLEAGLVEYSYNRDRYHGAKARNEAWTIGQMNVRVGILDNLELNALINPYVFTHDRDDIAHLTTRDSGIGEIIIGGKVNLFGNDSTEADEPWRAAMAIQPQFKLPSIDDRIGNGYFECSVGAPLEINLPHGFHLDLQPTVAHVRNTTNTGDATTFQGAVSLDHIVFSKLDVYIEYVVNYSTEAHTQPTEALDVGGTYPLSENLQLDAGCFIGLNKATPTIDVTLGVSFRF